MGGLRLLAVLPRGGAYSLGIDGCVGVGQDEKLGRRPSPVRVEAMGHLGDSCEARGGCSEDSVWALGLLRA